MCIIKYQSKSYTQLLDNPKASTGSSYTSKKQQPSEIVNIIFFINKTSPDLVHDLVDSKSPSGGPIGFHDVERLAKGPPDHWSFRAGWLEDGRYGASLDGRRWRGVRVSHLVGDGLYKLIYTWQLVC